MRGELKFLEGRPDLIEQARDILIRKFKNGEKINSGSEYAVFFENGLMLPFKDLCRAAAEANDHKIDDQKFSSNDEHRNDFNEEFSPRFHVDNKIKCDFLAFRHNPYLRIREELLPSSILDGTVDEIAYEYDGEKTIVIYNGNSINESSDLKTRKIKPDEGEGKGKKGYYLIRLKMDDRSGSEGCEQVFIRFEGFDIEDYEKKFNEYLINKGLDNGTIGPIKTAARRITEKAISKSQLKISFYELRTLKRFLEFETVFKKEQDYADFNSSNNYNPNKAFSEYKMFLKSMEDMNINYWHIQMGLPEGRGGTHIDAMDMLNESPAVIGTGEWESFQCTDFKNTMQIGDIICVRDGATPLALCRIAGNNFLDQALTDKYININWREVEVLDIYKSEESFPVATGTLKIAQNKNTPTWQFIHNWYQSILKNNPMKKEVDLLKFKKQIILQGPPGTGKTYKAKRIAHEIISNKIGPEHKPKMLELLAVNNEYFTQEGNPFILEKIEKETCFLRIGNGSAYHVSFDNIIAVFNKENPKIEGKSYAVGLANYLKEHLNDGRIKLIQFHPSYSYEDFVRGIEVSAEGESLNYEATNRVFAKMAQDAYKNAIGSELVPERSETLTKVYESIDLFKEHIDNEAAEDNYVHITKVAKLIRTAEDFISYKGDNWPREGRIPDKDLSLMFVKKVSSRSEVKELEGLAKTAKSESTYWFKLYEKFMEFLKKENIHLEKPALKKQEKQNYVLIVDEINRANLPSVLGELIYGLEYRNRPIESMYKVDGSREFIIPDNLYVIGTMNTADRSVGHIDYAIRRRFAFVDTLPDETIIKTPEGKELYRKVAKLFVTEKGARSTFMGGDFDWKDVQIGHSYFMGKEEELPMRWKYEIRPILEEYIKDGVLLETTTEELQIIESHFGYQ